MLWDSDKHTADDLIGRVTVPVVDLMLKPNQVFERTDTLAGFEDADKMQGTLSWSVAFYDKAPFNPKLKRPVNNELPAEVRNRPELSEHNELATDTQAEADALTIPPDPNYPAGIVSIIVHQINNLERQNLKGATGDREGVAGQDTDAPEQEGPNLPSSYCELVLNDEMVCE
jgi:Ca2+-dependent lipid-binding protein